MIQLHRPGLTKQMRKEKGRKKRGKDFTVIEAKHRQKKIKNKERREEKKIWFKEKTGLTGLESVDPFF